MSLLRRIAGGVRILTARRSYGLDGLDLKLRRYVTRRRGFFVEAGANDGITQSNTYYFERFRGWRGILIEPVPELAEKCRRGRLGCIVEQCALVPLDHNDDHVWMRYCNLMSVVKGGMETEEEELRHVQLGCDIQGVSTYELKVPAATLSAILDRHGVSEVDLLSLDVEGFELQALRGIDFERHRIRFILVEARYRSEIDSYLRPRYKVVVELSHHDVLYRLIRT